jgi:uncharacterized tellurite resistance protein B-like protein
LPTTTTDWRRWRFWCTPPASTATCRRASATRCTRSSSGRFKLDDTLADESIDRATKAEHEAVDLYHFTKLLTRVLDEEGRAKIIEMMWEIVYADGERDELEDNLLWRAADLLGVSPRERIELRQRIARETGQKQTSE